MQQRFQVLVKQNAKKQHKTIRVMHLRKVFKCFFWWGNNCWRHHVLSMERRVLVQNKVINDQKFIKVIERFLNWILKWVGNQCNPARLKTNNYLCLMFVRGLSAAFSYWCRVVTAVTTFTTYKHHKQARITHCEVKGHDHTLYLYQPASSLFLSLSYSTAKVSFVTHRRWLEDTVSAKTSSSKLNNNIRYMCNFPI